MSHHFFFEGVVGGAPPGAATFLPGNYTINGMYTTTATTETNYLMDSTAEGYAAISDFVIITFGNITTGSGVQTSRSFDFQGDGGSGSLLALSTGTSTGGAAVWRSSVNDTIIVPGYLLATAMSTRHGRVFGSSNTATHFVFCSWN